MLIWFDTKTDVPFSRIIYQKQTRRFFVRGLTLWLEARGLGYSLFSLLVNPALNNSSSSTSKGSFHGTGISIFQERVESCEPHDDFSLANEKRLLQLPYSEVLPVSFYQSTSKIKDYSKVDDSFYEITDNNEKRYLLEFLKNKFL